MDPIVVAGASGHAKVVVDILEKQGRFRVVGFLDRPGASVPTLFDYPHLGQEEDLPQRITEYGLRGVVVAIGDNWIRSKVMGKIRNLAPSLAFVSAIHPTATIGRDVEIGEGTVVMAGATINPGCRVGKGCLVNTNASLDHDSILEDYASLAPQVVTGGNCRIGSFAAISIGAVLMHRIEIGEHTVIGAGSLVTKSIGGHQVAYGSPARIIRDRKPGDRYL